MVDRVTLEVGDVTDSFVERALAAGRIAWDIETTGLDWRSSRIGTCQLATSAEIVVIQLPPGHVPLRLSMLLASTELEKVFHHAPFDLRFMAWAWKTQPRRVACTKILSKILDPQAPHESHSLKPTLERYLGIDISKGEQQSDWAATDLRPEQIAYAAADVRHLLRLLDTMTDRARSLGVWQLVCDSFRYLPARAALDIRGSGDVYSY